MSSITTVLWPLSGQPVLAGTPAKDWIMLEQTFTAGMPLLTEIST